MRQSLHVLLWGSLVILFLDYLYHVEYLHGGTMTWGIRMWRRAHPIQCRAIVGGTLAYLYFHLCESEYW